MIFGMGNFMLSPTKVNSVIYVTMILLTFAVSIKLAMEIIKFEIRQLMHFEKC